MTKHQGTRSMETRRLWLRPFMPDDARDIFENWASDPEVTRYLFWETHPDMEVTRAVLSTWVEQYGQEGYYNWAIAVRDEALGKPGAVIGNISVVSCSDRNSWAEIGYVIGRDYWSLGIMTEALAAVLRYLFETVGLHRVMLKHDILNVASGRVMIKNGMTKEGVLRGEHRRKDGTWADIVLYGMLRDEWMARRAQED